MTNPSSRLSESYPRSDYEWYASDASGHIAVFTSAGIGPIPSVVLASRETTDLLTESLWKMSVRGGATMLVSLPTPDDFVHFASRGFFAYDWQDVHRTKGFSHLYEMLSRPETPIHVSGMPEQFQLLFRSTALACVRFADSLTIDVRGYFDCEPAA